MTIIVADTTCGLPRKILEERKIPLIPQIVTFGEESYHDDKDLDTAAFLKKLKAFATLPKTSALSLFSIIRFLQKPGRTAKA